MRATLARDLRAIAPAAIRSLIFLAIALLLIYVLFPAALVAAAP
jgi:hypothetical protein